MSESPGNLGGGEPSQNRAGLEESSLALLVEDFRALERVEAGLPVEVLRYVVDGEGAEVLHRLTKTREAGAAMGFGGRVRGVRDQVQSSRARFFATLQGGDPRFFVRLGKVYEALSNFGKVQLAARSPHLLSRVLQNEFQDPRLDWLELLLMEATQLNLHTWPSSSQACPALTAEVVEAMLAAEDFSPGILVRTAFQPRLQKYGSPHLERVFQDMPGLAESAVRHRGELLAALNQADFKQRQYALKVMRVVKVPPEIVVERLVEFAVQSSKVTRQQARVLLESIKPQARSLLERKLEQGDGEERGAAAELLWEWEGESIRPLLEKHLETEKSKKVAQVVQHLIAVSTMKTGSSPNDGLPALPPLPPISRLALLSQEAEQSWRDCFAKLNSELAVLSTAKQKGYLEYPKPLSEQSLQEAWAGLQNGADHKAILGALFEAGWRGNIREHLFRFWRFPELKPIHFVRFLIQVGALKSDGEHVPRYLSYGFWLETFFPVYQRAHPEMGLREFAAAFSAAGLDPKRIGLGLLQHSFFAPSKITQGLPDELIWPYWAENLELLTLVFEVQPMDFLQRYEHRRKRENAFLALQTFPIPPKPMRDILWSLALGPKSERPTAQRCLEGVSDKSARLQMELAKGTAETRAAAAEWLGRLGDKGAIKSLHVALKQEKQEAAKGEIMGALERLGVPVEQFLDRPGLVKEMEKLLFKGIPEDLNWFPFAGLPPVHWAEDGRLVEPNIIQGWLVQGFKSKQPGPGPLLRKYCASLRPAEREKLGQFILEAWLAEDTAPISRADAEQRALQQAQQTHQFTQSTYWPKGVPVLTLEEYYASFLATALIQPKGSAVASKGVLSVAGACVGAQAAPLAGRYLKQWYGMRVAQCRALLQMLAWVEHKTATQLLLAVGSRFRTKSIQEEANQLALELANRKGWTVAELADRTIPSAGLDDQGVLVLDFGPRQFTARLGESLEFLLQDPEGKPIKALPEPRKDDDEAKAAEARKLFSNARKELKSVASMQRERFYEAMCTQRTWTFEDWSLYLNQHPIARHHCQRLVWAQLQDGKAVGWFRPLADGTLTNASDEPVNLQPAELIRLAHECQVTPEQSLEWREHLKDYEVEPLFEQFGRQKFVLPEAQQTESELKEFQGHLLEAFRLRGRANKLGYSRGGAQDGGWFFDYHKRFPSLGLEAVIEFTGNGLPEENRTVALKNLHFHRLPMDGDPTSSPEVMILSEVPVVLLSEGWNDLRSMAAEGSGFDPEWEKKSQS